MLKFIMDEQLFMIHETSHTLQDINDMYYIDFITYNNMYFNYFVKDKQNAGKNNSNTN